MLENLLSIVPHCCGVIQAESNEIPTFSKLGGQA